MFGSPRDAARRPAAPLGTVAPLEDRLTPVINLNNDVYNATLGQVLSVPATQGVLANDFSDINPGQVLQATIVQTPRYVGSTIPLPATPGRGNTGPSLFLNQDGSFTFVAPSANLVPPGVTQVQFTYTVTNLTTPGETTTGAATVTINLVNPGQAGGDLVAVGADAGGGPHVRVYESGSAILRYNFFPYETTFTGGVRVAVGDLNNDGFDDILTSPATGGAPRIRVFDGKTGASLFDEFAFDPNFRGGAYVAIGDFNGDGQNDIIVGAGEGGGPRIQVFTLTGIPGSTVNPTPQNPFTGSTGTPFPGSTTPAVVLADFFAFDPSLGGFGVRVAAGDTQGVGRDFIVASNGAGGGPEVRLFDINQILVTPSPNAAAPYAGKFFAESTTNTNGVYVSVGNFTGAGAADIVTGTGAGTPIVRVFNGRTFALQREFVVPADETPTGGGTQSGPAQFQNQVVPNGSLLSPSVTPNSLLPGGVGNGVNGNTRTGGARVGTTDYNGDGVSDIIVGAGPGNAPRARIFNSIDQTEIINILAFSSTFLGGVNVAGT